MRRLIALLLVPVAGGLGIAACGGTRKHTGTVSRTSNAALAEAWSSELSGMPHITAAMMAGGYLKDDGDGDLDDDNGHQRKGTTNDDVNLLHEYGSTAGTSDRQTIAALVKRYFAAAASGDGATACSLIVSSLATQLAKGQSPSSAGGRSACATAISQLFKQQHRHLAVEDPATMAVPTVRVKGALGLAVLGFRATPEGQILVEREGRAWKLGALFDSEMT